MKNAIKITALTVLSGLITHHASAALVTYNWVPDSANNPNSSSGSLTFNTTSDTIVDFSWQDASGTVDNYFSPFVSNPITILVDNDLQLHGYGQTSSSSTTDQVQWVPYQSSGPDNGLAEDIRKMEVYAGDWVPVQSSVPEPATVASGLLLLLPFGVSALRKWRKGQG